MIRYALILILNSQFFILNCFPQSGWFWQNPLPQGNTLIFARYINPNICFATGGGGSIIKSTDSGINWFLQSTLTEEGIRSIFFTSLNTGFAVGTSGLLIKTTDGGMSWNRQYVNTSADLWTIGFANPNTGFTGGFNSVLKTTDGGTNWLPVLPGASFYLLQFTDSVTGYTLGENVAVYKTTNAGSNWTAINVSAPFLW